MSRYHYSLSMNETLQGVGEGTIFILILFIILYMLKSFNEIKSSKTLFIIKNDNISEIKKIFKKWNLNLIKVKGLSPLMIAIENGSINTIKFFIEKKANVNFRSLINTTPISTALAYLDLEKHYKIIELLIKNRADLNVIDISKETPLTIAMKNQTVNLKIVKLLIENGANINSRDSFLRAALSLEIAKEKPNLELIKYLVEKKANLNIKSFSRKTPLYLELEKEKPDFEIVKYLIENGSDVNVESFSRKTPIFLAIDKDEIDMEIVEYLIKNGADLNFKNINDLTALHIAVLRNSNIKFIKFLIENGADLNIKDSDEVSAFNMILAEKFIDYDFVNYLIENGAQTYLVDNHGRNSLYYFFISKNKDMRIVDLLLDNGMYVKNFDSNNQSSLMYAAMNGSYETFNKLLPALKDINVRDYNNQSLLMGACLSGNVEIAEYLIENGANMFYRNKEDITAINIAEAYYGSDSEIIKLLLKNMVNKYDGNESALTNIARSGTLEQFKKIFEDNDIINKKFNNDQKTLLMFACDGGNIEIVEYLIKNGANISLKDTDGNTALSLAVRNKNANLEIVKSLVENGADVNDRNNENISLLAEACLGGNLNIIKYLVENGADVKNDPVLLKSTLISDEINLELIKYLVKNGADVHYHDNEWNNMMVYALTNENVTLEIIQFLLDNGIYINYKNNYGDNALMLYLKTENPKIKFVKLLIKNRIDLGNKNKNGETAIYEALSNDSNEILELLLENNIYEKISLENSNSLLEKWINTVSITLEKLKLILDKRPEISLSEYKGCMELLKKIKKKSPTEEHIKIYEYLLSHKLYNEYSKIEIKNFLETAISSN